MNNSKYLKAQETLNEYEANSMHGQLPVYWKSAKGSTIKDHNNK